MYVFTYISIYIHNVNNKQTIHFTVIFDIYIFINHMILYT